MNLPIKKKALLTHPLFLAVKDLDKFRNGLQLFILLCSKVRIWIAGQKDDLTGRSTGLITSQKSTYSWFMLFVNWKAWPFESYFCHLFPELCLWSPVSGLVDVKVF